MITQILFEIPAAYEAAVKAGSLVQIGGLLKNAATGQIVAHLQESGLAHSLISTAVAGAASPLKLAADVMNVGSGVYTAVQVTQLKSMIASLQSLQIATLGVSLVGLGVTVAGFIYMHKRFNSLDGRIDKLIASVHTGFESQREAALRAHMSQVKGLVKRAKQAPTLSRPEREYSRIAEDFSEQASHFEGELEFLIKVEGKVNVELFWQLAQVLTLCNSIRIDCRIRTNELRNAREIAESVANDYQMLFDQLTPGSFQASEGEGAVVAKTIRDITDAAATKPYLIEYLRTQRYDGREYLDRLENETQSPLLMLRVL
ncbi:MAG: hypothetical protein WC023_13930 [Rhodocyclaceae bacterium]